MFSFYSSHSFRISWCHHLTISFYFWFDKSGTMVRRAGLSTPHRFVDRILKIQFWWSIQSKSTLKGSFSLATYWILVIRNTHFSLKGKAGKEKKAAECHFPDGPAFAITQKSQALALEQGKRQFYIRELRPHYKVTEIKLKGWQTQGGYEAQVGYQIPILL